MMPLPKRRSGYHAMLVLLACALAWPVAGRGGEREDRGEDEHQTEGKHGGRTKERREGTELEDVMGDMNTICRRLRRQAGDQTQNGASLELAARLKILVRRAAALRPARIARTPVAEQPKLQASYEEQMQELLATVGDLEKALKTGRNNEALKILDDMRELQNAGHHKFRTKEDSN